MVFSPFPRISSRSSRLNFRHARMALTLYHRLALRPHQREPSPERSVCCKDSQRHRARRRRNQHYKIHNIGHRLRTASLVPESRLLAPLVWIRNSFPSPPSVLETILAEVPPIGIPIRVNQCDTFARTGPTYCEMPTLELTGPALIETPHRFARNDRLRPNIFSQPNESQLPFPLRC